MIMNIKDSVVLMTGGNYRIQSFNESVLHKHINKDISLTSLSWVHYTIDITEWLLSKYITLRWDFLNQYDQINKIYSTIKIQCGLWAYLFKEYSCDITTTIDFDLPIVAKFDTIIMSWKVRFSQKGN